MSFSLFIILCLFFVLLFHYQRQDKIYIGYTTVLCLLFGSILIYGIVGSWLLEVVSSLDLLTWIVCILGALLIYVTSQLTLAFEKINRLSQEAGFRSIEKERLRPQTITPDKDQAHHQR